MRFDVLACGLLAPAIAIATAVALPQHATPEAAALVMESSVRAAELDLAGAARLLQAAVERGHAEATVAALYAQGLVDAKEAARRGGTVESLAPVRAAVASLERIAGGRAGSAEIARLMLQAAAAAAQSERDEMRLYLDAALGMEAIERAAGRPGAPLVSAAEIAGDLWLLVHRYEEARQAYAGAGDRAGPTLRILAGRARVARGIADMPAACTAYRALLEAWAGRSGSPIEIAEGRRYLADFCPAEGR